jgi:hypothetical protein
VEVEDEAEESDSGEPTSAKKPAAPSVDPEECRARMINIANKLVDMSVTLNEFGLDDFDFKKKQRGVKKCNTEDEQEGTGDINLEGIADGNTPSNPADVVEHVDDVSDDDSSSAIDNNERIVSDMRVDMESIRDDWDNIQKEMIELASLLAMKPSGDTLVSILHDDIYKRLKSIWMTPINPTSKSWSFHRIGFLRIRIMNTMARFLCNGIFGLITLDSEFPRFPAVSVYQLISSTPFVSYKMEQRQAVNPSRIFILNKPIDPTTAQTSIYQSYEIWCGPDKKWICNIDILRQRGVNREKMLRKVDSIVWLLKDSWSQVEKVLKLYEKK